MSKEGNDDDIYSKSDRSTSWRLVIDLLNIDSEHCGYSLSFMVYEAGRQAGKTVLHNHVVDVLSLKNDCTAMAIDTENSILNGKSSFVVEGNWTGSYNNWVSADKEVINCGADKVIDLSAGSFEVHLDAAGGDLDHVGVRGWIKIPWIGRAKDNA